MAVIPSSERVFEFAGRFYKIFKVNHSTSSTAILVDQTATSVVVVVPSSNAPTAALGAADANFEKTITLTGGALGDTVVVVGHSGPPSSVKPSSRS